MYKPQLPQTAHWVSWVGLYNILRYDDNGEMLSTTFN